MAKEKWEKQKKHFYFGNTWWRKGSRTLSIQHHPSRKTYLVYTPYKVISTKTKGKALSVAKEYMKKKYDRSRRARG